MPCMNACRFFHFCLFFGYSKIMIKDLKWISNINKTWAEKASIIFQFIIKYFIFENIHLKVFWIKMCLSFAQLLGFPWSALCFPILSSLYSLHSSRQELCKEYKELCKGMQRVDHGKLKSYEKNRHKTFFKIKYFMMNWNIIEAF